MNITRLQGWALIISVAFGVAAALGLRLPVLLLIGVVLFMFGVPAIQTVQPMGLWGVIGIVLLELAALIALVLNIYALSQSSGMGGALPLTSAIAGALGRLIIGWLTTRGKVFAAWVGWAFILDGLLQLLGGAIELPQLGPALGIVGAVVMAAALLGYGFGIIRHAG